ncbi:2-oxo-4-hydroxy-4-carboxy-5-ureidoimidazoline decarboxylase [Priestia megaterium]|uniref:2-oxo-4-hydroxy-4-carboxy-5-ureidoimidazoline decarboxylase n=1 Tax=Priestia megaterium TaxID=1404 RepID=UPI00285C3707|nr:2-oxo-4-hydroxy-4-carboxy-5-ureidoimidazoline decarboxylase [Priestia megaterium]MDR7203320.1 2-oxo-4-hydroxy-4-carboxy--5-ureidoimidazoline (OHCU) decarboxylase [Priestia megaterium]
MNNVSVQYVNQLSKQHFVSLVGDIFEHSPFPFILAVRGKQKEDIYEAMQSRLLNTEQTEFDTALEEVYKIAFFRLTDKITEDKETKKRA